MDKTVNNAKIAFLNCPDYTIEIPPGVHGCIKGKEYQFCTNPKGKYIGCVANRTENECPNGYE